MMKISKIKKTPVQIIIPGGRIRSLNILCKHLEHEKKYFDECFVWINTNYPDEIDYIKNIEKKYDFIKYIEPDPDWEINPHTPAKGITYFANKYCNEDKIYIRLDDDICYIEEEAIKKLIDYRRISNDFLVYGNCINNSGISEIYYNHEIYSNDFLIKKDKQDSFRLSGEVALKIHAEFLKDVETKNQKKYYLPHLKNEPKEIYCPVNVISFYGNDFKKIGPISPEINEEVFFNSKGNSYSICGNALFAHMFYYTQRSELIKIYDSANNYSRKSCSKISEIYGLYEKIANF